MELKVKIEHEPDLEAMQTAINAEYANLGEAFRELHFLNDETYAIVYDAKKLQEISQYRATTRALKHRNG